MNRIIKLNFKYIKKHFKFLLLTTVFIVIISLYHLHLTNKILVTPENKLKQHNQNLVDLQKKLKPKLKTAYNNIKQIKHMGKKKPKYILVWAPHAADLFNFENLKGELNFKNQKCPVNSCYITDNRYHFGDKIDKFDAIIFHGKDYTEFRSVNLLDLPKKRSPHQIYIFYETRSAYEHYICVEALNKFFNWTMTYKLNSDIVSPFINIRNKTGQIIGPKVKMHWNYDTFDQSTDYITNEPLKTQAILWLETSCTRIKNEKKYQTFKEFRLSLGKYGLDANIISKCTMRSCKNTYCSKSDRTKHFFYVPFDAFENKYFVNEEMLTDMENGLVPIATEGIDFSSFLPPYAYINGHNKTTDEIVSMVVDAMMDTRLFQQYFRWKKYYTYEKVDVNQTLCTLCAALNNEDMLKNHKAYDNFLGWWNPDYQIRCQERK